MKSRHGLLLAGICLAAIGPLPAQVTFTDALNSASGDNWIPQMQNRGLLYFPYPEASVQGLIFMNLGAPTTSSDTGLMTLKPIIFSASAAADWSVKVDVHLSAITLESNVLSPAQFVNLNLIVSKADDPTNYNATLAIDRHNNGSAIVHDFESYLNTAGSNVPLANAANPTELATLRFSYTMSGNALTYAYDPTGPGDGESFTTLATQSLAGWGLDVSDAFIFTLVGSSGATSGTGPDLSTYAPGYFQAFSVTGVAAVPEPSTYAAIFGLCALGFAAWRRRFR